MPIDLSSMTQKKPVTVAILGAGFGGIAMAIKLQKQHKKDSFVIIEKGSDFGGTWRDNSYPGAECDVQSHLYSLADEQNPNWSKKYASQGEIKAYIDTVAKKHDLAAKTVFDTAVTGASFDEKTALWQVTLDNGKSFYAHYCVVGFGPLHVPSYPPIKGLDDFKGEKFHSALWNHDYDLAGKTVVGIGTGASAIQFLPEIAPKVKELHVMQRSAAWILPKDESPYPKWRKTLFKKLPITQKIHRQQLFWGNEMAGLPIFYPKYILAGEKFLTLKIKHDVKDKQTAQKLIPDYRMGCKRILKSNKYYPMYNRDNVHLHTGGVKEITTDSVITNTGDTIKADCIIFGTGFHTDPRKYLRGIEFAGLNGIDLLQQWQKEATGYMGVTTTNFPNFFMLVGPNSNLGHNSLLFMIETQVSYICNCIDITRKKGADYLVISEQAQNDFNDEIQDKLKGTAWDTGCNSWYKDETGKNFSLWAGLTYEYWLKTRHVHENHYDYAVAQK